MWLAAIRSVIDVGCGLGGWLRAFSENVGFRWFEVLMAIMWIR
jgi:hypothetical protein